MTSALMKSLLLGTALAAYSFSAVADDVIMFKEVPSVEEINSVLFGTDSTDAAASGQRTRSIRIVEPSARAIQDQTRAIRMHKPETEENALPSHSGQQTVAATTDVPVGKTDGIGLGFNLQFAFDSVDLLPDSRPYIDRLGEVMGAPENQEKKLLIMGHTDARGSQTYNNRLSMKRAESVKRYLTTTWNIPETQLQIKGAGESEPLAGTDPNDGINRRVEFFALN